ncbi:RCC1-like domain-containing protein [Paenibacillus andongensis]
MEIEQSKARSLFYGSVWSWGSNGSGQLGLGDSNCRSPG